MRGLGLRACVRDAPLAGKKHGFLNLLLRLKQTNKTLGWGESELMTLTSRLRQGEERGPVAAPTKPWRLYVPHTLAVFQSWGLHHLHSPDITLFIWQMFTGLSVLGSPEHSVMNKTLSWLALDTLKEHEGEAMPRINTAGHLSKH